jgi:murein DD-endopeptidase MepM/ murein hydrolase activator NlpD
MSKFIKTILIVGLLLQVNPVSAQDSTDNSLSYIVQPGDTLNSIAYRLGISPIDLADANSILDPNKLSAGEKLFVPGLPDIHGVLTTKIVPLGETFTSLSRRYQIPADTFVRLNHMTSPAELYAGASVFVTQQASEKVTDGFFVTEPGQSLLEASVLSSLSPWTIMEGNRLSGSWDTIPGERFYYQSQSGEQTNIGLLPSIVEISIQPLPIVQGKTTLIRVTSQGPVALEGSLGNNNLHFFQIKENEYVAFQGIYAMADPGLYPISIKETLPDGSSYNFDQMILLKPGYYPKDPPLQVDPVTIDPAVTKPEDTLMAAITKPVSPDQLWKGMFIPPVDKPICINSWFGSRRSYNNSPYTYFHTGLDYGVCANLFIYAPAAGVVVYTGSLTVRGNATIIDHGWGVYSGFWHQKEIKVKVGDRVEPGQVIGLIGGTGRVNGPHLHWEVWVNGNQVDPEDWLAKSYDPGDWPTTTP